MEKDNGEKNMENNNITTSRNNSPSIGLPTITSNNPTHTGTTNNTKKRQIDEMTRSDKIDGTSTEFYQQQQHQPLVKKPKKDNHHESNNDSKEIMIQTCLETKKGSASDDSSNDDYIPEEQEEEEESRQKETSSITSSSTDVNMNKNNEHGIKTEQNRNDSTNPKLGATEVETEKNKIFNSSSRGRLTLSGIDPNDQRWRCKFIFEA